MVRPTKQHLDEVAMQVREQLCDKPFLTLERLEVTRMVRDASGATRTSLKSVMAAQLEESLLARNVYCYPPLELTTTGDSVRFFSYSPILRWLLALLNEPKKSQDELLARSLGALQEVHESTRIVHDFQDLLRLESCKSLAQLIDGTGMNIENSDLWIYRTSGGVELQTGDGFSVQLEYPFTIDAYWTAAFDLADEVKEYWEMIAEEQEDESEDEDEQDDESLSADELEGKSVRELREIALDIGVRVASRAAKRDLVAAILGAE